MNKSACKTFSTELGKLKKDKKITAEIYGKLSGCVDESDPFATVSDIARELDTLFKNSKAQDEALSAIFRIALPFIGSLGGLDGFERDVAVVCAYLTLCERANASIDLDALKAARAHSAEFDKSLQNISRKLPIFAPEEKNRSEKDLS